MNVGMPNEPASEDAPSILTKAFDVLRAFTTGERVMTLSEISRASRLPKSTVHRILARLVELGAVEHHRAGYKIGLDLLRLGTTTPASSMRDRALPYLANLHRWSGQTVQLGVLRQFDVVYLEKVALRHSPVTISRVGARLPANCTAIGKALLAYEDLGDLEAFLPPRMPALTPLSITEVRPLLDQLRIVRRDGFAHEHEEAELGLACVASPIVLQGFAVGAVSVSFRSGAQIEFKLQTALRHTTARIAKDIRDGLAAEGRPHWFPREL